MLFRLLVFSLLLLGYVSCGAQDHPVFLVTKSKYTNLRMGPGKHYDVRWIYTKRFVPLRVLATLDRWVKVQDCEGSVGWVMSHLLYKRHYVMSKTDGMAFFDGRKKDANVVFTSDACVIMKFEKCKGEMCRVSVKQVSGWAAKSDLWGVDEPER